MSILLSETELGVLKRAIFEAEDALETLRRGHGTEVSGACFPALNSVREAAHLLRTGAIYEPVQPQVLWKGLKGLMP